MIVFSSDFDFGVVEVLLHSCDVVHLFDFVFVINEDISLLLETFEVNSLHSTVAIFSLMFDLGVKVVFFELLEIVEWDLLHSCVEINSFDLESWVEEVIFELLKIIKGDLSHSSVTKHSFDLDSWVEEVIFLLQTFEEDLSHSSDTGQSFDFIVELKKIFWNYYLVIKYIHLNSICVLRMSFFILLESFEDDLLSTDDIHSFDFKFSSSTSSMVIMFEFFWGSYFDLNNDLLLLVWGVEK